MGKVQKKKRIKTEKYFCAQKQLKFKDKNLLQKQNLCNDYNALKTHSKTNKLQKVVLKFEDVSQNWKQLQEILKEKKSSIKLTNQFITTHAQPVSVKKETNAKEQDSKVYEVKEGRKTPEIWFDDVDPSLLGISSNNSNDDSRETLIQEVKENKISNEEKEVKITKAVAIDCEMVGVGDKGNESMLARVSIVNEYGDALYDKFVKPLEDVSDYRTFVSGVRPEDLENAEEFQVVLKNVSSLLKNRILIGHSVDNDLKCLFLSHPRHLIRDTSCYPAYQIRKDGKTPSLRMLCKEILGLNIQDGEHSSVEDARAVMKLYLLHRKEWDANFPNKKRGRFFLSKLKKWEPYRKKRNR